MRYDAPFSLFSGRADHLESMTTARCILRGNALSLPRKRFVRRSGTSATSQETALSGAFFRLSSGCLSTRLRREQSRQQLVSCSFPCETWARAHLRETRLGPNVPVFLVGLRKAALLALSPPLVGDWSACLPLSLVSFFRGLVAAPVAHFAFWAIRSLLQRRVQVWAQRSHRFARLAAFETNALSPPALHHVPGGDLRSTVNAFNAYTACSRATFPFLSAAASSCSSCTFLPCRQPLPASSSCLRDSILADAQGTRLNPYRGIFKANHYA